MRMFTVSQRTQFYDTSGIRLNRGNWTPTHYGYVDIDGDRWLLVSDHSDVTFRGQEWTLAPVPTGCVIKGLESLERTCTAGMLYKRLVKAA